MQLLTGMMMMSPHLHSGFLMSSTKKTIKLCTRSSQKNWECKSRYPEQWCRHKQLTRKMVIPCVMEMQEMSDQLLKNGNNNKVVWQSVIKRTRATLCLTWVKTSGSKHDLWQMLNRPKHPPIPLFPPLLFLMLKLWTVQKISPVKFKTLVSLCTVISTSTLQCMNFVLTHVLSWLSRSVMVWNQVAWLFEHKNWWNFSTI